MQTEAANFAEQDAQAVRAVRTGDAERYRELVERHERRVYAVAWSRLGDAALAEEATQEAFIRAYRRLWLLGDGAKFASWIASIARHVAINFGLRHRRELNKRERWALEQAPTHEAHSHTADMEAPCTPETLRQTLAELPTAHRECLVLFYLEGKSGTEAATTLGISEAALRVRLHRARAALRERLEERLGDSLRKLGPDKTLVPAIMAGVLASSSAKAATAGGVGVVVTGALAKIGLTKWLLPLGAFFSFLFLLPMLLMSWLVTQLELKNFRDQKGFRARLFRSQIKNGILLIVVAVAVGIVMIPLLARLVDRGFLSGLAETKPNAAFLLIAAFILPVLPFSLRLLTINRNPFLMASIAGQMAIGFGCLLGGLNMLPPYGVNLFIIGQALFTLLYYGQRPIRMDYNLFLRAAENLLPESELPQNISRRSKSELIAFARFLGTRWLVNHFRWSHEGLRLRLPPVGFSQWTGWTDLMFNGSFRRRSHIRLGWDGSVTAQLGEKDRRTLVGFRKEKAIPQAEWEARVANAVAAAWDKFAAGDSAKAERTLGQTAESEVFVVPPAKGGIARVRWLMAILLALCLVSFLGIRLPGCRTQLEKLNGLYPVNITGAQVHEFMSLVSTNPNSLVPAMVGGTKGYTQKSFAWDPSMALFTCLVLPETNLFTPRGLQVMRDVVAGGDGFEARRQNQWRVQSITSAPLPRRALADGWISWQDLNLQPLDLHDWLRTNRFPTYMPENWDYFLARSESWSWVKQERFNVMRIRLGGVTELRLLRSVNCLDLVDREKLIQQIAAVQTLSAHPPGNPPIHDWKDVRGLFFTPCWPALQDTYFSLAALEILGGLDRVDREACIEGILRVHGGKGFFMSPDSGGYNEYHIDGSAQDTIAAYESLRILGALDRVKDLDQWQFRVNRRHLAKDEVTWHDIEAWVCQQRLARILSERKASPQSPVRSLLEP